MYVCMLSSNANARSNARLDKEVGGIPCMYMLQTLQDQNAMVKPQNMRLGTLTHTNILAQQAVVAIEATSLKSRHSNMTRISK